MKRSITTLAIVFLFSQILLGLVFNPPQNLVASGLNDSVFLDWDAPQSKALSHYNIYYKGMNNGVSVYLDSTSETEYKQPMRNFAFVTIYEVAAVYANPDGTSDKVSATITCPSIWEAPLEMDFEEPAETVCGLAGSPLSGQTDWGLSETEYMSEHKSAFYFSDTAEHQSLLYTTIIEQEESLQSYLSFYFKAPQIEGTSDTLFVYYSNTMQSGNFPEDWTFVAGPFTNANDWTKEELSLEGTQTTFHLGFLAVSGGGDGVYLDDFKIFEGPSDVEEISKKNKIANLYPMPATDEIFLDFTQNDLRSEIIIYNLSGEQLFHQKIQNKVKHTIDVSKLPEGMYLIKVVSDQIAETHKLIICR
ncbi:MAG: T9SS type A sorting domain-containing protein [Bacteroidales bacterium]|nr:T9SS type A sorting domain-containing protein [Bacteroidales bacterium]